MRFFLWALALSVLAVACSRWGLLTQQQAVLIMPPYRIELAINLLLFLLSAAFAALYFIVRATLTTFALPRQVKTYRQARQQAKAQQWLQEAQLAYFEGRYARAEQLAAQALEIEKNLQSRAISALLAAASADAIKNAGKRDAYLSSQALGTAKAKLAKLMTQATGLIKERRFSQALDILSMTKTLAPKLTTALRLELVARQQLGQHALVLPLIAQLQRSEAISPLQADELRRQAQLQQLRDEIQDPSQFKRFWNRLEPTLQRDARIASSAVRKLTEWGDARQARELLIDAQTHQWDDALTLALGQSLTMLSSEELLARLNQAERWLEHRPEDALLLLTLGRLCRQQQLWGKAQSYLEASLSIAESGIAHIELARLLTQLGQIEAAARHFEAAALEIEAALTAEES